MRIEAHFICYNESEIIKQVVKHYQSFCEKVFIHDNYSLDSSQLIAESLGCDVLRFGIKGSLDDLEYLKVKNNRWRGSDADYIIMADMDEVLWHPDLFNVLEKENKRGTTIFKTQGWQIYSNQMPKEDMLEITTGWPFANYSKPVIFSPKHIENINYDPGCHIAHPTGNVIYSEETLYLLHYRNIGGVDRLIRRYREYQKRMSFNNKKMGYGVHYWNSEKKLRQEWYEGIQKSKPLI